MTVTITDPELIAQLRKIADTVELVDPDGNTLGLFDGGNLGRLPPGVKSPLSDEELAERRKHRTGRTLAEIFADLQARG